MSTRSRIGLELASGKIKSIYCHWDGYPEGVGATLKAHYTNPEKIEELLSLGDISCLGDFYDKELAEKAWKRFDKNANLTPEEEEKISHMTQPYNDRGEETSARIDDNEFDFANKIGDCWEDYAYLYKQDYDGVYKWFCLEPSCFKVLE